MIIDAGSAGPGGGPPPPARPGALGGAGVQGPRGLVAGGGGGVAGGRRPAGGGQRPVPVRQSVYEALVELVVGGRLGPGEHLVETELARQLGGSRQPVREALHRLEAEGWVDLRPSQGAFVHVPTDQEVDELLDVRELLEAEMARLAARSASADAVARLRAIWQDGEVAVGAVDTEPTLAASNDFPADVAGVARNTIRANLAPVVSPRVRWYYRMVAP